MKYLKYMMLAVLALTISSCSDDDDDWNTTASTTVSLPSEGVTISETSGIYTIPIEVTGARNGKVKVTVEVSETGTSPAQEDVNYILTSKTCVIGEDTTSSEGYIELETIDDDSINDNRTFTMTITSAEGAEISNASTVVTIKDNDSNPYDRLQGTYTLTGTTPWGDAVSETVTIQAPESSSSDYGSKLYLTGMNGYDWNYMVFNYKYDESTEEGYLQATMPQINVSGVNFGSSYPSCDIELVTISATSGELTTDNLVGLWSEDFSEITFANGIYAAVLYQGSQIGGWFGYSPGFTLTKNN